VELKSEIQAEQVQKEYDGPQAPRTRILTLIWNMASPGASHQSSLTFLSIFIIMFCLIVHLSLQELSDNLDAL
jgi:hypothetical protein